MVEIVQALSVILMFSVLIQFCVDRVKEIVGTRIMGYIPAPIWSLAFGLLFAFLFRLDFFAMLGLAAAVPLAAQLITGLILSAGSAPIHELIQKLRQSRINDELILEIASTVDDDPNPSLNQRKKSKAYEKADTTSPIIND